MTSLIEMTSKTVAGGTVPPSYGATVTSSGQDDSEVFDHVHDIKKKDESDKETSLTECCSRGK